MAPATTICTPIHCEVQHIPAMHRTKNVLLCFFLLMSYSVRIQCSFIIKCILGRAVKKSLQCFAWMRIANPFSMCQNVFLCVFMRFILSAYVSFTLCGFVILICILLNYSYRLANHANLCNNNCCLSDQFSLFTINYFILIINHNNMYVFTVVYAAFGCS